MFAKIRNELINLAAVERVEMVRGTRGQSMLFYAPMGAELAVMPAPYRVPEGFLALHEPRVVRYRRSADVMAVWVNPTHVSRLVADDDGSYRVYDLADRLLGSVRGPLNLPTNDMRVDPIDRRRDMAVHVVEPANAAA